MSSRGPEGSAGAGQVAPGPSPLPYREGPAGLPSGLSAGGFAAAALAAGALAALRPYDALSIAVAAGLGAFGIFVSRKIVSDETALIVRLFVMAFVIRVLAAYVLYHFFYLRNPGLLAPDEVGHDRDGMLIASYWRGNGGEPPTFGYDSYVGLLYFLAPGFQLLPRLVNAFGGALTASFVGACASNLFGRRAARSAGFIAAFWPSAILWSSLNLKDGWSVLAIAIISYELSRLHHRGSRFSMVLPGMLVGMGILAVARAWMLFVVVAGLAAGLVRTLPRGRVRAAGAVVILVGGTLLLISLGAGASYIGRLARVDVEQIRASTTHGASAVQGGINVHNPAAAIRSAPAALGQVLLAPYPWSVSGVRQALALPEQLVWYLLLPVIWVGIRRGLREAGEVCWPILAASAALILAIATLEGNLGLIYRHRLSGFVVLFIFAGAGWAEMREPERVPVRQPEHIAAR